MSKTPNPPAFPTDFRIQHGTDHDGMTLRDYFAGQALAATLDRAFEVNTSHGDQSPVSWATNIAYRVADAMLQERAK